MKNINKFETTERPECNKDTKLFFDDVCTNSTRTKKAQVETAQCGRSMIEMLGVLAIVGVLSVGGIAGYSKAMEKFKINKTMEQAAQIINNIQILYAQQKDYDGLHIDTALQMGVIPDDISSSIVSSPNGNSGVANPLNGIYYITDEGIDNGFNFSIAGINKDACIQLATVSWGTAGTGLRGVSIGSGYISWEDTAMLDKVCSSEGTTSSGYYMCVNKLPFPVAKAAQYCACETNDCYVSLVYGK